MGKGEGTGRKVMKNKNDVYYPTRGIMKPQELKQCGIDTKSRQIDGTGFFKSRNKI